MICLKKNIMGANNERRAEEEKLNQDPNGAQGEDVEHIDNVPPLMSSVNIDRVSLKLVLNLKQFLRYRAATRTNWLWTSALTPWLIVWCLYTIVPISSLTRLALH